MKITLGWMSMCVLKLKEQVDLPKKRKISIVNLAVLGEGMSILSKLTVKIYFIQVSFGI